MAGTIRRKGTPSRRRGGPRTRTGRSRESLRRHTPRAPLPPPLRKASGGSSTGRRNGPGCRPARPRSGRPRPASQSPRQAPAARARGSAWRSFLPHRLHLHAGLHGSQIVHQVPGFVRRQIVFERGHRRAVETGHENLINVFIGASALEARALAEIVGNDGAIFVIGERGCRWPVAAAVLAVALPAFHALKYFGATRDALRGVGWFGRNLQRGLGLFSVPPG